MSYKELIESGVSTPEMQSYLTDSELVTVTLRLPRLELHIAREAVPHREAHQIRIEALT